MAGLLRMLGLAYAAASLRRRMRRLAFRAVLAVLALILALAALAFFLVALTAWLAGHLGAIAAACIVGGGLLVLSLVLLFVATRQGRAEEGPAEQLRALAEEARERLKAMTGSDQPPLRNPIVLAALAALAVGFVLGRRGAPRRKE